MTYQRAVGVVKSSMPTNFLYRQIKKHITEHIVLDFSDNIMKHNLYVKDSSLFHMEGIYIKYEGH